MRPLHVQVGTLPRQSDVDLYVEGMHSTPGPASSSDGAQPGDPPAWRLLFMLIGKRPWFATLRLTLILGALVALGILAGPWLPGVLGALGITGAVVKARAERSPPDPPDPALDPPPA